MGFPFLRQSIKAWRSGVRSPSGAPLRRFWLYDTFNRADAAAALGTSDTGRAWTNGTDGGNSGMQVASNRAAPRASTFCSAVVDLGVPNVDARVTIAVAGGAYGLGVRLADTDQDDCIRFIVASGEWLLQKIVSGSATSIGSGTTSPTPASGQVMRIVASGTAIRTYVDGTLIYSATITEGPTNTRAYLVCDGSSATRFDTFEVRRL